MIEENYKREFLICSFIILRYSFSLILIKRGKLIIKMIKKDTFKNKKIEKNWNNWNNKVN